METQTISIVFALLLANVTANIDSTSTESTLYLKSLRSLNLRNSNLTILSPSLFSNVSNLQKLDLSENNLQIIEPDIFDLLTDLEELILNNCNITYISSEAFKNLGSLTVLELAGNNFKSDVNWTSILGYLGKLEHLDLSFSNVSLLPTNVFSNNIGIRKLLLGGNKNLSELNISATIFQKLVHLDYLDISECNIGHLPLNTFNKAKNLRTLFFNSNRFTPFLSGEFKFLRNLVKLSLRNCKIAGFEKKTFFYLTKLQYLDLSENNLVTSAIEYIYPLVSLEHLNLTNCNLLIIPSIALSNLKNLKELILSGNSFNPYLGVLSNHSNLRVLEMNNCYLSEWSFGDGYAHPNLEVLRMSHNRFYRLYEGNKLTNLKIIDMSYSNLSYLPASLFNANPRVEQLLLSGNKLKNDNDSLNFIKPLTNLQQLDLSYNQITSIQPDKFNYNPQLVSLNLVGNPWKCNCYINDIWQWIMSKRNITMLDGSTNSTTSNVNNYEPNGLVCDYDPNSSPLKVKNPGTVNSTYLMDMQHTWAEYVLEANCTKK